MNELVQEQHNNGSLTQNTVESRIAAMQQNIQTVRTMMQTVLKDGEHYGKIPGTDRPALLKPGAEKLLFVFRLGARYTTTVMEMPNGHREYRTDCSIFDLQNQNELGSASGSCSTMESKYRYRNVADFEITGLPIPPDSKERKSEYRKQGFGMKKVDGVWEWVKFKDSQRTENPDIADVYNTVLKMSQKRALIAVTLNVLAVSDMFTQDIDEDPNLINTPHGKVNPSTGEILDGEPRGNSVPKNGTGNYQKANRKKPEPSTTNDPNMPPPLSPEESYRKMMTNLDGLIANAEGLTELRLSEIANGYRTLWLKKNHPEPILSNGLREIDSFLASIGHPVDDDFAPEHYPSKDQGEEK